MSITSIFSLLIWLLNIVGTPIFVETPSHTTVLAGGFPAQESNSDAFEFDRNEFREDPEKGFSVAFKILTKAKRENAPPETIARLH